MRALTAALALVSAAATAEPRLARDTADVGDKGQWSMGIFNPLQVALHDRIELRLHPALFFLAPNFDLRLALLKALDGARAPVRVTLETGAWMPTLLMRVTKGYLFPTWAAGQDNIGWMVVFRGAVVVSGDAFTHDRWTLTAGVQQRIPLGPNSATPLHSFLAPLELLFAAPTTGFLGRLGAAYDHAFGDRFRLHGALDLYVTGPQGDVRESYLPTGPAPAISPVIITAHLGLDIAVFKQGRVALGVLYANYDTGDTKVVTGSDGYSDRVRVRSNNFLPTLDYIWSGF
jgi:hypothetical protein